MNCPRCQATIGPLANPDGIVTCPGCGSRLMTRSAAIRSQGGARTTGVTAAPEGASSAYTAAADLPPSATLPPTPAMMLGITPRRDPAQTVEQRLAPAEAGPPKPTPHPPSASGRNLRGAPAAAPGAPPMAASAMDTLELILHELRAVKAVQQRILERLEEGSPASSRDAANGEEESETLSPIRARHQKTVVLVDDDPGTRDAAVAELLQADVPVRAFESGNAAVAAIAEERPDVIVLELGLGGEMAGKDLINIIKSTMEWVDIPIVLWTREAVPNQKEARLVHGADEVVAKAGGAAALVARVIALFRRVH